MVFFHIKRHSDYFIPSSEAIIDGRILMVLKTGFLTGTIVLPQFIIDYIKHQASLPNADVSVKRGDMVIETLMNDEGYNVMIEKMDPKDLNGISRKIVRLAVIKNYRLLTIENELEPFTKMVGVKVLKLKDLGMALKQVFFKGDILSVKPVKRGRYTGEGIGYLDDNSTVVIEGASTSLGKVIRCKVISVLDLPTGRVIFSKIEQ
ncbi:putative PIN and TRAM-domain containing protein YacL [subsurface metagenome]